MEGRCLPRRQRPAAAQGDGGLSRACISCRSLVVALRRRCLPQVNHGLRIFAARTQKIVWSRTQWGDQLGFAGHMQGWALWKLVHGQTLLTLLTVGLYWPFAAVAIARYRIEAIEALAVLAHEIGHVVHRHGMSGLVRSLGLLSVAGTVLGDFSTVAASALGTVQGLRYSCEAEREADLFARRSPAPTPTQLVPTASSLPKGASAACFNAPARPVAAPARCGARSAGPGRRWRVVPAAPPRARARR